jgi:hypothetical protein
MNLRRENKKFAANVEVKESEDAQAEPRDPASQIERAIERTGCPDAWHHRDYLYRVCPTCNRQIPGHGYYTTEEIAEYFPTGMIISPLSDPAHAYTSTEAKVMRDYVGAFEAVRKAGFEVLRLKDSRKLIQPRQRVGRHEVEFSAEQVKLQHLKLDTAIQEAKQRQEDLEAHTRWLLLEHGRLGKVRESQGSDAVPAVYAADLAAYTGTGSPAAAVASAAK